MPGATPADKQVRDDTGSLASATGAGARPPRALIGERTECVFCRYDLAGIAPDGTCPECGREARLTVEPDWIRTSSRRELEGLRRACACAWLVPLCAAAMVALAILYALTSASSSGGAIGLICLLAGVCVSALSTHAWRRLLPRGGSRPAQERAGYRPGAWGVLSVAAGWLLTLATLTWLVAMLIELEADWGEWLFLGGYIGVFVGGSLHVALALGGLARRFQFMHRARLARWTRVWAWCSLGPALMFACAFLSIVGAFSGLLGGPGPTPTERMIATIGTIGVFLGWIPSLAALIGGGVVVNRFRKIVGRALLGRVGEELGGVGEPARPPQEGPA